MVRHGRQSSKSRCSRLSILPSGGGWSEGRRRCASAAMSLSWLGIAGEVVVVEERGSLEEEGKSGASQAMDRRHIIPARQSNFDSHTQLLAAHEQQP